MTRQTFTFKEQSKLNSVPLEFKVLSAIPEFKSSDDALVSWAQDQGTNSKDCLFVTSDQELQERITKAGGMILRPKLWFGVVNSSLGEDQYRLLLS